MCRARCGANLGFFWGPSPHWGLRRHCHRRATGWIRLRRGTCRQKCLVLNALLEHLLQPGTSHGAALHLGKSNRDSTTAVSLG